MISLMLDKSPALDLKIPHHETSRFYAWKGKVFFAVNARGDTLEAHIAASGRNKRLLRQAVKMFCQFMFSTYPSYKKIVANVNSKSVKNLCLKCGFVKIATAENAEVMALWAV